MQINHDTLGILPLRKKAERFLINDPIASTPAVAKSNIYTLLSKG